MKILRANLSSKLDAFEEANKPATLCDGQKYLQSWKRSAFFKASVALIAILSLNTEPDVIREILFVHSEAKFWILIKLHFFAVNAVKLNIRLKTMLNMENLNQPSKENRFCPFLWDSEHFLMWIKWFLKELGLLLMVRIHGSSLHLYTLTGSGLFSCVLKNTHNKVVFKWKFRTFFYCPSFFFN